MFVKVSSSLVCDLYSLQNVIGPNGKMNVFFLQLMIMDIKLYSPSESWLKSHVNYGEKVHQSNNYIVDRSERIFEQLDLTCVVGV